MKIVEIVHLRAAAVPLGSLGDRIAESIKAVGEAAEVVTLYRRDGLETDLAVHIHHVDASGTGRRSALGLRLASELANLGMVAHTVWQEV